MKAIWKILSNFFIIALTIAFVRWYVKGHFGKYFLFFWLNTIIAIGIILITNIMLQKKIIHLDMFIGSGMLRIDDIG